jgi:nickel-dependent lactate racemase
MSPTRIEVPANEWYGDNPVELQFPDNWTIHEQRMAGHIARSLTPEEIAEKLQNPVGSSTLRELAKGKRRCAIVFDDMTRPTKIWQMLPAVLDELHKGSIADAGISFVMASGSHGARMLPDFRKKLGDDIPERFLVFNHNPYENLVDLGETSQGTHVKVNREVMSCDLKVTVGALMPHFGYGFGGGAKMLLPGVAGIDSIWHNHNIQGGTGPGRIAENRRRHDSEEAARMAGIDFSVNAIINADRDITDLVCGDVVQAQREGVRLARRHYSTPTVEGADISIGNGYPMANEGYKAYHIAVESVREGGDLVFLVYTPEGCRVHYYNGRFGTDYGGRGWTQDKYVKKPWKMDRIIVISPETLKADEWYYGVGAMWVNSWTEALRLMEETHGPTAEVALYPYAAMQISERNAQNK